MSPARPGLTAPVIYGGVERNDYIVEAIGCGAAFLDYDNDGWLDIFLLSGTRWEDAPSGATNRLYHNNRDGTFTDVTEKAGLTRTGWACGVTVGDYNNDGFEDLFLTYWGQNVLYRNNGDGTFTDVTKAGRPDDDEVTLGHRLHLRGLRSRRAARPVRRKLHAIRSQENTGGRTCPECNLKGVLVNCGPRGLPTETHRCITTTGTAPSPTSASMPESRPPKRQLTG